MNNFDSVNTIQIYEVDGKETLGLKSDSPKLKVTNHWNRRNLVVLQIEEGPKITIVADELERAMQNAQNSHV